MIVVDSSVWIANLREELSKQVLALREMDPNTIIAGDIIVLEVLRGIRSERQVADVKRRFEVHGIAPMLDPDLVFIGAAYYRFLRSRGLTVRTIADLIIATYCLENGHDLLHQDRDFDHFERYFGLRVVG